MRACAFRGYIVGGAASAHTEITSSRCLLPLNEGAPDFGVDGSIDAGPSAAAEARAAAIPLAISSSSFVRVAVAASLVLPGSFKSFCRLWVVGALRLRPRQQRRCAKLWCFRIALAEIEALSSLALDPAATTSSPR